MMERERENCMCVYVRRCFLYIYICFCMYLYMYIYIYICSPWKCIHEVYGSSAILACSAYTHILLAHPGRRTLKSKKSSKYSMVSNRITAALEVVWGLGRLWSSRLLGFFWCFEHLQIPGMESFSVCQFCLMLAAGAQKLRPAAYLLTHAVDDINPARPHAPNILKL